MAIPKPAAKSPGPAAEVHAQDLHPCPIYNERINEALCGDQTRIVEKNQRFCSRLSCASPWRLCGSCIRQGVIGPEAKVSNAVIGLCDFHRAHGAGAKREQAVPSWLEGSGKAHQPPARGAVPPQPVPIARRELVAAAAERAGKGPDELPLPTGPAPEPVAGEGEVLIPRELIDPNPHQPRRYFDPTLMRALTASIAEAGQIDPIIVVKSFTAAGRWTLLKGERRYRACTSLDIKMMKAVIRTVADACDLYRQTAITDLGHVSYTAQEKAHAIRRIMQDTGERNIVRGARIVCLPVAEVYKHLSLFKLHPEVWAMMNPEVPEKQRLGLSAALYLAGLSHALQLELAKRITSEGLGIREARALIRRRAAETGERSGIGRGRKRDDDFRLLRAYLDRTRTGAEQLIEDGPAALRHMFGRRDPDDLNAIIGQVKDALSKLEQLLEALHAVRK